MKCVLTNFVATISALTLLSMTSLAQPISFQQLSGPHGGGFYSIVADTDGNIYANTIGGPGPFKSTDDGETWFSIMNGLIPYSGQFHPLAVSPGNALFIGGAHSTAYLCRSTDGGSSWTPLDSLNTAGTSVLCIVIDKAGYVYVGTGNGIYRSTDDGEHWSHFGMAGSQVDGMAVNDSGHVFAGTSYAVYRSTDGGANWTPLPTGGGTRTVAIGDSGYIFAGRLEGGGILRSTDNGNSWDFVYPQVVSVTFASTPLFAGNGTAYFPTWGEGVLKSTDYGATWNHSNTGLGYPYVRALTMAPGGNLLAGTQYGIFKSTDSGAQWYSVGLNICGVRGLAVGPQNNLDASAWGMHRSTDSGLSWETIDNGLGSFDVRSMIVKENGEMFIGTNDYSNGILFRSTDSGDSWTRADTGLPTGVVINGLAVLPSGELIAGGSGYASVCHISTDDGGSWTDIANGAFSMVGPVAANADGDIFAASNGIWRKLNGDTAWSNVGAPGVTGTPTFMFIAKNRSIYSNSHMSTDNGTTWTPLTVGSALSSVAENSLGHLFAGTPGSGVYRSTDDGGSWEQISGGLTNLDIRSVAIDTNDFLYAGSWGKSVFRTTTSTLTDVGDISFEPVSFSLSQNYPNPFNPTTTIDYDLPATEFVKLTVYDMLGREVRTLVDGIETPGRKSVSFNAEGLSSGTYYYRLRAGERVQTRELVVVR
jgi:photosystem II stability/assembly factor-like uncharacterized protein